MGLLLVQKGNRLANLACRTRHLLLLMLLMERRGKEVAVTSAVIIHPSAPGHILVAAVSFCLQGFGIRWNHSHISAHGCPSRVLDYPTEITYPHCRILTKPLYSCAAFYKAVANWFAKTHKLASSFCCKVSSNYWSIIGKPAVRPRG